MKQSQRRQVRQMKWISCFLKMFRDVPQGVSTRITKCFGIGSGPDTEGIENEPDDTLDGHDVECGGLTPLWDWAAPGHRSPWQFITGA